MMGASVRRDHEVKYVIDAGDIGGVARYINHSCDVRSPTPTICCAYVSYLPDRCMPYEPLPLERGRWGMARTEEGLEDT